jgi:hypothetical protein
MLTGRRSSARLRSERLFAAIANAPSFAKDLRTEIESPPAIAAPAPAPAPQLVHAATVTDQDVADDPIPLTAVDEELLTDLFVEIGMLRMQIEVLRSEIGGLVPAAEARPPRAARVTAAESRPRTRSAPPAELPPALRRSLGALRGRRQAGR